MGIRGEVFSTKLLLQNRTYFFNVKENRMGDLYLNIVESKNKDSGGFERQSVIIFSDDLPAFLGEFDKSLRVLEKAAREQGRNPSPGGAKSPRNAAREKPPAGERRSRTGRDAGGGGEPPGKGGRRVVVKKRNDRPE
ncbi:MAG: DUF3276 family protein [Treponema sp.]|jgi:hypothetical protein|nr:DUF3276 family protein [Treponema sp.]